MNLIVQGANALSRRSVFGRVGRFGVALSTGLLAVAAGGSESAEAACGFGCEGVCACTDIPGARPSSCCEFENSDCTRDNCCCECTGPCCIKAVFDFASGSCNCNSC